MNKLFGVLLIMLGVVLGLYVGVWILFVGGILDLVDVVNLLIDDSGLDGMLVVWGVLKMMFAGFVAICAYVGVIPGVHLLTKDY